MIKLGKDIKKGKALSIQERAQQFLWKQLDKKEYVVNFDRIPDKKLKQFLKANDYIYNPCRGIYIIKSAEATNNATLEHNYFQVIEKLGGVVGGDIALNYHTGHISKVDNIEIITPTKNGEMSLGDDSNYIVRYQKSTIYRDVERVEINGASFIIEKPTSFLINNFSQENLNNSNFKVLLSSTNFMLNDIEKLVQKGANINSLSKMALWYKDNDNARNYTLIKTALQKNGKGINYAKDKDNSEALKGLDYLFKTSLDYNKEPAPEVSPKLTRFNNFIRKVDNDCDEYLKGIDLSNIKTKTLNSLLGSIEKNIEYDSYHSLTIENYKVTPEEIQILNNPTEKTEKLSDKIEEKLIIKGYLKAYKATLSQIKLDYGNGSKLSKSFIVHINNLLFSELAVNRNFEASDKYRAHNVEITNTTHIPTEHRLVPEFMQSFVKHINSINTNTKEGVIKKAVLSHFLFVYVHPFGDGNGRVGRFLMNYVLGSDKIDWVTILAENKKEYIDSLKQASEKQNIRPFTKFIVDYLNKTD